MDAVDIDVENLFNDGQLDNILPPGDGLQPTPLTVPGLAEHFLNLRYCGGFNRVSWSRQGHVAIISEDGLSVSIQCLHSAAKSGEWKLSTPRMLEATFENAINVAWSPSGFDLAIVDTRGRVGIHSMTTTCLNRLNESKAALSDTAEELGMTIGSWWLNQDRHDRSRPIVSRSTREGDKWVHQMTKAKAHGPLYPRAFCMVNRHGTLSLTYQRPGARYARTSFSLPCSSGVICSHAAFAPTTEGKVLLAVYSTEGNLAVYLVAIDWQPVLSDRTSDNQPDLTVETIDACVSMWADTDGNNHGPIGAYKPDEWALTHLTIVPTSDVDGAIHEPPSIWATFVRLNAGIGAGSDGFPQSSVIRRWSVQPHTRVLHSRFDEMPTKTETSIDDSMFVVDRLTDIGISQPVYAVELIDGGQAVAISTSDGRTEFWNPITQELISYEGQSGEITSLPQFGFVFPPAVNAISVALSPNACSSLCLSEDSKPSLRYLQYPLQTTPEGLDLTDPQQSASVAATTLAFARSCWSTTNGDDVLACILANYTPGQYSILLSEMYRTFFKEVEFVHEKVPGSEAERLVSKPLIIKVLSVQMALFSRLPFSINAADATLRYAALASVWAWLATNFRYIATTFYIFYREYQSTIAAQQNPNAPPAPPISAAFTEAICNTIHWVLDLFRFMFTTILEIGDRQTNPDFFTAPTFANNLGDENGDGSQGLVALILNCQWSRSFLGAIYRTMRAFIESNERGPNPHIALVVRTIHRYSSGKGMSITAIDKLLDPRSYALNGLRKDEQMNATTIAKRQMAMYHTGRVGPEYANTLRNLLDKVVNKPDTGLRATGEIQRMKLWADTPDLNWLLLGFNPQFSAKPQAISTTAYALSNGNTPATKLYDVHRKSVINVTSNSDQLVRRCVRCGSISGDISGIDKTWSKNMVPYLAKCICDAYWLMESIHSEVEHK